MAFPLTCCQFRRSKTEMGCDVVVAAVLPVLCVFKRLPTRGVAMVSAWHSEEIAVETAEKGAGIPV